MLRILKATGTNDVQIKGVGENFPGPTPPHHPASLHPGCGPFVASRMSFVPCGPDAAVRQVPISRRSINLCKQLHLGVSSIDSGKRWMNVQFALCARYLSVHMKE